MKTKMLRIQCIDYHFNDLHGSSCQEEFLHFWTLSKTLESLPPCLGTSTVWQAATFYDSSTEEDTLVHQHLVILNCFLIVIRVLQTDKLW